MAGTLFGSGAFAGRTWANGTFNGVSTSVAVVSESPTGPRGMNESVDSDGGYVVLPQYAKINWVEMRRRKRRRDEEVLLL